MAQLKDLIVTGATRLIGNAYAGTIQITTLNAPTAAGGTTYGPGTNGYVLKSNGSSVYWGSDNNSITGVKGNAESSYRTGQVNLTAANIGAPTTTGTGASGIWAISISGNASTATKFATAQSITLTGDTTGTASSQAGWSITTTTKKHSQSEISSLSSFTDENALIYAAAGGSNTVTDKPSEVDAFGVFSYKTASGWYGQLLTSSNTGTGLYWRTGTTLSAGWKKVLDSTNYTDYTVTKTGTGASGTWGISISGNAATATKLATARNINGTSFDGSADITTANWGTARNISISDSDGTNTGTAVSVNGSAAVTLKLPATIKATLNGNASTATKLQTARAINGTNFDGSANITTANWGTARTITIGGTGKSVNGSADVSWTKTEILGSGNTGQFLRGDHSWSNELTGSFYAGTADTTSEYQIRVTGGAGSFYLYSQPSSTGDRGIYSIDASNNSLPIITATNDNMVYFGHSGIAMDNNPSNYGWKQFVDSNHTTVCSRLPGASPFGNAAIEIRETNEIGTGTDDNGYAPKLGFHWSGKTAGFLELNKYGWFQFRTQTGGNAGVNVGALSVYNGYVNLTLEDVDASLANNNVSSAIYPTTFNIMDSASRIMCRSEAVIFPGGTIRGYWYVRNYNTSGGQLVQKGIHIDANKDGSFSAGCDSPFYGAVWNDYAEYRESNITEPGRCIRETGNGDLVLTTKRLEKGCEIISDTFGFAIGQSDIYKTPTAATGRVLAYLLEPIEEAKKNIGQAVCSGPNGTVSIMTDEECRLWPQCIIGTISEIPDYEIWHAGMQEGNKFEEIQVNGRIWIRIR